MIVSASAHGQVRRPADERPELPTFEAEKREPGRILPVFPVPREPEAPGLSGERFLLKGVRITGNTVLPDDTLATLAEPYLNRMVSFADLSALRDELTLAYVRAGYVSSGAVIPDQPVDEGIVEIRIAEGVLADLEITTDGRFHPSYFRSRLERKTRGPVNVYALEEALQLLQQDDRIRSVHAELVPGEVRGESFLRLRVAETTPPYRFPVQASNYESPAIGSVRGRFPISWTNVTGYGDRFTAAWEVTRGLHELDVLYVVPLTSYDTTLDFHVSGSWADVVEEPFDTLDIESRSQTYGMTLTHPLYRSLSSELGIFLTGEFRKSKSFLLGDPFSFVLGPENGVSKVAVLRFGQSWVYRGRAQVLAARSMLSFGLDALGATKNSGNIPDGQFVSWLGQLQWARRFAFLDAEFVARTDVQLTNSPLLGLEQFAMGGHATVRGYRENLLVRDNGFVSSVEVRVPLWKRSDGRSRFELGPFIDVGYSWNQDRPTNGPTTLVSVGLTSRFAITDRIDLRLDWGEDLKNIASPEEWNLQDAGIHFALTARFW